MLVKAWYYWISLAWVELADVETYTRYTMSKEGGVPSHD